MLKLFFGLDIDCCLISHMLGIPIGLYILYLLIFVRFPLRPGCVSVNALDSGSRGCVFDPCRGRFLDFVVVGSNPGRGSPSLSSLRGRYSGYHEFLVGSWSLQEWRHGCIVAMKQSNLTTLFCTPKPKCRLYGDFYILPSTTVQRINIIILIQLNKPILQL